MEKSLAILQSGRADLLLELEKANNELAKKISFLDRLSAWSFKLAILINLRYLMISIKIYEIASTPLKLSEVITKQLKREM